jgi:hypothetical protein
VRADNQTCRPLACVGFRQSIGLHMQPSKGAGQQAGNKGCKSWGLVDRWGVVYVRRNVGRWEGVRADNQTCRPLACLRCRQSIVLDMQPAKGAGQQAGNKGCKSWGLVHRWGGV